MRIHLFVFFSFSLLFCFSFSFPIQIDNNTLQFVDDSGRSRIFHGVNAVYKIPPWHPSFDGFNTNTSLVFQDMEDLQNWGFNAIRLGVMWPGVSTAPNEFNETYLDIMNDLVTTLGEYGIYSIIDCHQDVFSRYFCGEGAPDWLVPQNSSLQFPLPIRLPKSLPIDPNTGYPNITSCEEILFFYYYFTDAVGNAFQDLYENINGIQDHFIEFWQQVAGKFKDNQYVLGYELINEPWCGDVITNPDVLLPGYADKNFIFPMYQNINNAIRSIDNEHIIFYEPAVSDLTACGFTEGPGGPSYNNRQAYSYHIYCAPLDTEGDPTLPLFCNDTLEATFNVKQSDRERQNVAGFMTEFGAMKGTTIGVETIDFITNLADSQIQSWCYWQYKDFNDITTQSSDGGEGFYVNGNLDVDKVKALSRTYAPIIPGTPTVHQFNPTTGEFNLSFTINNSIETEDCSVIIFANQDYYYSSGMIVTVSSNLSISNTKGNYITISCIGQGVASVKILPKTEI